MAVDAREGSASFLNDPRTLDDPFPDPVSFRQHRPVFSYQPVDQ